MIHEIHVADAPSRIDLWSEDTWHRYLDETGLASMAGDRLPHSIRGGVSSYVVRVGGLVFKQPRARLNVEEYWRSSESRFSIEAGALQILAGMVPTLHFVDPLRQILALDWIDSVTWRSELLAGRVDLDIASHLGRILSKIHATTDAPDSGDGHVWELRYQPYLIRASEKHEDLSTEILALLRMLSGTRSHLIHGDFSPKNILIAEAPNSRRVTVIDLEVAHRGHPCFDLGFMLSHLIAKAVANHRIAYTLVDAMRRFLAAYGPTDHNALVRMAGALLLARVDGASRLDYLSGAAASTVRRLGRALITASEPPPWEAGREVWKSIGSGQ